MDKVRILVVEDEIIIADSICEALEEGGYIGLEPCINYSEAIEAMTNDKPDIAILDIQLSGKKTGIDVAEYILKKIKIPFIFLTSNSDRITLDQAKLVRPNSFLVKPFNPEELYAAIEISLHNYSEQISEKNENLIINDAIFVKSNKCYKRVNLDDIVYINSDNVYIDLHLNNGKRITIREKLSEFLITLNGDFTQVHRSYVINLKYLDAINHVEVIVKENHIPISRTYRDALLSRINKV